MKKIKCTLFLAVSLFMFVPLIAQDAEESVEEEKTEQTGTKPQKSKEELIEERAALKLKQAEEKKKAKEEKAAAKEKLRLAKQLAKDKLREKKDKYLGIVYVPEKKYEIKRGLLRLTFKGTTGSFNVLAKGEDTPETALLSQYEGSSSTYFSAKVNNTVYRLNKDAGVSRELRKLSSGAQLAYTIEKKAQVVVDFVPVSSVMGAPEDMVRVTVYTTNISKNPETIAVKGVFDTILGEGTDYHFITSTGLKIRGEKKFGSMKTERSIISTNSRTSVQFVLYGQTIASPDWVSLSNRDSLAKGSWVPEITDDRSFNTVLAYNNSSIAVNWPAQILKPEETTSFSFYIVAGVDSRVPNGLAFIDQLNKKVDAPVEVTEVKNDQVELKKPAVDFIVSPSITDSQLDPEYIQNLIDRINALQSDPLTVDRQEVRQLNRELDAILEKIRQQKNNE